jgi:hypothetical protein
VSIFWPEQPSALVRWHCCGCGRETEQEAWPSALAIVARLRCLTCGEKDAWWWVDLRGPFRQASS